MLKAFPQLKWLPIEEQYAPSGGMDLRDYFAAKAMQAIITASDSDSNDINEIEQWLGDYAYFAADLMMKAREKC